MKRLATPARPIAVVGAFEAKTHLSRLLEDARGGTVTVITVRGKPVAKLVPAEAEVLLPSGRLETWLERLRETRARTVRGPESTSDLIKAGRRE